MRSSLPFSRRAFGSLLAAPLFAQSQPAYTVGIEVRTLTLDAAIAAAKTFNLTTLTLARDEYLLSRNPAPGLFTDARRLFDRARLHCFSYRAATLQTSADIDRAIHFAQLLGASAVTGDAALALLPEVDRRFNRAALSFAIHNHTYVHKFPYESPEDIMDALSKLSLSVGSDFDPQQFATDGYDAVDAVRKLAPRIEIARFDDISPRKGIVDNGAILRELKTQRYPGLVVVDSLDAYRHMMDLLHRQALS